MFNSGSIYIFVLYHFCIKILRTHNTLATINNTLESCRWMNSKYTSIFLIKCSNLAVYYLMVSTTVYGGYFTLMCVYSCGCVCFVSVHILLCECMFVCLCNCFYLCEWYWDIHTCWYIIKKTGHYSDGSAPMSEWQRLPWRCLQTLLPPFSLSSPQAEGLVGRGGQSIHNRTDITLFGS